MRPSFGCPEFGPNVKEQKTFKKVWQPTTAAKNSVNHESDLSGSTTFGWGALLVTGEKLFLVRFGVWFVGRAQNSRKTFVETFLVQFTPPVPAIYRFHKIPPPRNSNSKILKIGQTEFWETRSRPAVTNAPRCCSLLVSKPFQNYVHKYAKGGLHTLETARTRSGNLRG